MVNYISKKIENQYIKIKKIIYQYKLSRFLKQLKQCGKNVFIQFPIRFEGAKHISVGNNVSINAFVHIWGHGGVEIGDDTLIASHVSIVSVTHDPSAYLYRKTCIEKKVTIGRNVWIGTHATILPGIEIGDNAIVAAGSVVNKNVEANTTVAGVPAKLIKRK